MKTVIIDCGDMYSRRDLHDLLQRELNFPEWYGRNLDALYDCLTDCAESYRFEIHEIGRFNDRTVGYGDRFVRVLCDAGCEAEII